MRQHPPAKKGLPYDWIGDYVRTLTLLSGKHVDSPEAIELVNYLRELSRQLYVRKRGALPLPTPQANGYYPVFETPNQVILKTAIRANSKPQSRERAWKQLLRTSIYRPPVQRNGASKLNAKQIEMLDENLLISIPQAKGRIPGRLGRDVPGWVQPTTHPSVVSIRDIDPEEWAQGGFTMRKFRLQLPRIVSYQNYESSSSKQSGFWSRFRQKQRQLAIRGETATFPNLKTIPLTQARNLARKLSPPETKIRIARKTISSYHPQTNLLRARPNAGIIAHEATHARQAKSLGRFKRLINAGVPIATLGGLAGGYGVLASRTLKGIARKRLGRLGWATALGSQVPNLALEGHANWYARKYDPPTAKQSMGSYLKLAGLMGVALPAGFSLAGRGANRFIRTNRLKNILRMRRFRQIA